jgi:CO/xanthine dehydrogenase FAD-binding subunit
MSWVKQYELAASFAEAEVLLAQPGWMLMGGGSHIVAVKPAGIDKLVDLMLLGLDGITEDGNELRIGARLHLEHLVERKDFEGLLEQAILSLTHSPNMRNQMTLAGETAWVSPMNELQVALLALDAVVHRHGREPTSAADYLAENEHEGIITEICFPLEPGRRHHFDRIAPGEGARPLLAFAATATFSGGRVESLRLAVGNLGPFPQRLKAIETRLAGASVAEFAGETLREGDHEGLVAFDSPGADIESKWSWLETMIGRGLAELARPERE